ncbi:30S ribosomal protein S2 [Patescibacteria group bacterium]
MKDLSLQELLEAGVHFGHQPRRWNPKMKPYLYAARDGVHIFDLVKTKQQIEEACDFIKSLVAAGKIIVFVGTKRQAAEIIVEEAKRAKTAYVSQRWLGGTITNWPEIKKRIDHLAKMKEAQGSGEYKKYTKKENVLLQREINRLEKFFGGISLLEGIPDALFIVDIKREEAAIKEARKKGVKIVAVVDSNTDPTLVDYPVPGNDDAIRSIKLLVTLMADAVLEGQAILEKKQAEKAPVVKKGQGAKSKKTSGSQSSSGQKEAK